MPLGALRASLFLGGDPGIMELQLRVRRRDPCLQSKQHLAEAYGSGDCLVFLGAPQKLRVEPSSPGI
jgi:hypothetical protein